MTAKNNGVIQPWILCDDRVRQSRQLNTGYNGYGPPLESTEKQDILQIVGLGKHFVVQLSIINSMLFETFVSWILHLDVRLHIS